MGKREKVPHKGIRTTVGENLARLMEDKGISADQIASGKLVDRRTINRLKAGETGPTIDTIGHIADALNIKLRELFIERIDTPAKGEELLHGKSVLVAERNRKRKDKK